MEQNLVRGLYEAARAHAADWTILQALPTSSEDEEKDAPSMNVFRKHISAANKENAHACRKRFGGIGLPPQGCRQLPISGRKACASMGASKFHEPLVRPERAPHQRWLHHARVRLQGSSGWLGHH